MLPEFHRSMKLGRSIVSGLSGALHILFRELLEHSRRRQTYLVRFSAALAMSAFILFQMVAAGGGTVRGDTVLWIITLILGLFSPFSIFATAPLIRNERQHGTLPLLFLSNLSAREVIWGKMLSASVQLWVCSLVVLPVVAAAILMGGVTLGQVIISLLLIWLLNLWFLSFGMLASVLREKGKALFLGGMIVLAIVFFLPPFLASGLYEMGFNQGWSTRCFDVENLLHWEIRPRMEPEGVEWIPLWLAGLSPAVMTFSVETWMDQEGEWWVLLPLVFSFVACSLAMMFGATRVLSRNWNKPIKMPAFKIEAVRNDPWKFKKEKAWRAGFRTKLLDKHPLIFLWNRLYNRKPRIVLCVAVAVAGVGYLTDLVFGDVVFTPLVTGAVGFGLICVGITEVESRISRDKSDGNLESILSITGPSFVVKGAMRFIRGWFWPKWGIALFVSLLVVLWTFFRPGSFEFGDRTEAMTLLFLITIIIPPYSSHPHSSQSTGELPRISRRQEVLPS